MADTKYGVAKVYMFFVVACSSSPPPVDAGIVPDAEVDAHIVREDDAGAGTVSTRASCGTTIVEVGIPVDAWERAAQSWIDADRQPTFVDLSSLNGEGRLSAIVHPVGRAWTFAIRAGSANVRALVDMQGRAGYQPHAIDSTTTYDDGVIHALLFDDSPPTLTRLDVAEASASTSVVDGATRAIAASVTTRGGDRLASMLMRESAATTAFDVCIPPTELEARIVAQAAAALFPAQIDAHLGAPPPTGLEEDAGAPALVPCLSVLWRSDAAPSGHVVVDATASELASEVESACEDGERPEMLSAWEADGEARYAVVFRAYR